MNEIVEADRPWSWHGASRSAARHALNGDERDAVDVFSSAVQMTAFDALWGGCFVVGRSVDSLTVLRMWRSFGGLFCRLLFYADSFHLQVINVFCWFCY